jgi:hypothetical protein
MGLIGPPASTNSRQGDGTSSREIPRQNRFLGHPAGARIPGLMPPIRFAPPSPVPTIVMTMPLICRQVAPRGSRLRSPSAVARQMLPMGVRTVHAIQNQTAHLPSFLKSAIAAAIMASSMAVFGGVGSGRCPNRSGCGWMIRRVMTPTTGRKSGKGVRYSSARSAWVTRRRVNASSPLVACV